MRPRTMTDVQLGPGRELLPCPECGAPVHPDPFYQKAHADFFKMNPDWPHVPIDDDQRAAVEALRRQGGDGSPWFASLLTKLGRILSTGGVPQRRRQSLDRRLMHLLGHEWCGNDGPPLDGHRSIYVFDEGVHRVFSMQDDGGFVGIGYPDEWHVIMRTRAARLLALWTLKMWLADWCGLRSDLYYRALHHSLDGSWRRLGSPKRVRAMTRYSSHEEWREGRERR